MLAISPRYIDKNGQSWLSKVASKTYKNGDNATNGTELLVRILIRRTLSSLSCIWSCQSTDIGPLHIHIP
jgi:hypothetical protein